MMNNWQNTADEKIIEQYLNGLEVPKDELTPIERMTLFAQGKEVDRLPCCLSTGETMAPLLNMSIDAYYHSSEIVKFLLQKKYAHATFPSDVPQMKNAPVLSNRGVGLIN